MRAPVSGHEIGGNLQLLLDVGGVGRLQDVGPGTLVLPVDHLPATGQRRDHVGSDLIDGHQPLVLPRLVVRRLTRDGRRPVAAAVSAQRVPIIDLGPVHDAAAEDALVREHVAVLVLLRRVRQPQSEGAAPDRIAERADAPGSGGPHRPGLRRRLVVGPPVPIPPGNAVLATAEVPVVAATTATRTARPRPARPPRPPLPEEGPPFGWGARRDEGHHGDGEGDKGRAPAKSS